MRVFKGDWFAISDLSLCDAVSRANKGLIDADLGGGLIKQRVARRGAGKSGGYRTLIFFRAQTRAIFVFGFAKSDQANLNASEELIFRRAAKLALAFSENQIEMEIKEGRLVEVLCDD